jgi:hypothetical protein
VGVVVASCHGPVAQHRADKGEVLVLQLALDELVERLEQERLVLRVHVLDALHRKSNQMQL